MEICTDTYKIVYSHAHTHMHHYTEQTLTRSHIQTHTKTLYNTHTRHTIHKHTHTRHKHKHTLSYINTHTHTHTRCARTHSFFLSITHSHWSFLALRSTVNLSSFGVCLYLAGEDQYGQIICPVIFLFTVSWFILSHSLNLSFLHNNQCNLCCLKRFSLYCRELLLQNTKQNIKLMCFWFHCRFTHSYSAPMNPSAGKHTCKHSNIHTDTGLFK